jgi:uncharacterized membrane protein
VVVAVVVAAVARQAPSSLRRVTSPEDPFVADAATAIGGPPGEHALPVRRVTALVVCLAVAALTMAVGAAVRTECATGAWWEQNRQFANLCYSDIPHQYVDLGLAEQVGPLDDADGRWPDPGLSAPTAVVAYVVARISQAAFGVVDPVDRNDAPAARVAADPEVHREAVRHTAVAAVVLALAALAATALIAGTHRSRPFDAMGFAAAPVLVLSGLIGWDLLAVVCASGAIWAWSRERSLLAGVLVGLGAAFAAWPAVALVAIVLVAVRGGRGAACLPAVTATLVVWLGINATAYVLRPDGWLSYWDGPFHDDPALGSLWRVPSALGFEADAILGNQVQLLGSLLVLAAVAWVGTTSSRTPRVAQLALLTIVGLLLFSKTVPVQAALWVLPFAVLARPRWRDLLIWQACETFYFLATWWHLGGYTEDSSGGHDAIYPLAVLVRTGGLLWLAAMVLRDVRSPWHDPVRASAVSAELS